MSNKRPYADRQKIGDTIQTLRPDLGENWLLCNGDLVDKTTYPELYALLLPALMSSKSWKGSLGDTYCRGIAFGQGQWLAVFDTTTAVYTLRAVNLWDTPNVLTSNLTRDRYAPSGYSTLMYNSDNNKMTAYQQVNKIMVSTSLGSWTTITLGEAKMYSALRGKYLNGTWVLCCYRYPNGMSASPVYGLCFVVGDTPNTTSWFNKNFAKMVYSIAYGDTRWVVVGKEAIYYTAKGTAIDGTYITKTLPTGTSIIDVVYGNGYWVAVGQNADNKSIIMYTNDIEGEWNTEVLSELPNGSLEYIVFGNGQFIATGKLSTGESFYVASSDGIVWRAQFNIGDYGIIYEGGIFGSIDKSGNVYFADNVMGVLPTISGETYTYIKAKEDMTE